ncbi:hypothetical protein SAMN02745216_03161 [Desulfatibacillum alkenivorans DSM 16219]|jgi:hypothetical protein|uniref:Uncharacterized protein n=1 Tax=Desulfatibacillum alkenivorans DSM 16219 TaxID=1121393 RepID=A0A1M6R100_9BACT|nr:hypothetical protein [Desulfatibacillum alkenivorans]SHK26070.1 hypothetical protein SAMN02745216_03161 [Desulfatibacillum alkenivorans DSM 16219]
MISKPIADLVQAMAKWGKSRGPAVQQAYLSEGDWSPWAQVEQALQFINTFGNVTVTRNQTVHSKPDVAADLLVAGGGPKKIAISLTCELHADTDQDAAPKVVNPAAGYGNQGGDAVSDKTCEKVLACYEAMKNVDLSQYSPVVMGMMVSNTANDAAKFYLCDLTGFQAQSLYQDKSGGLLGLYFKSL